MTATDELRRMLDERGVEWMPIAWNPKKETFYHTPNGVGFCADEYTGGVRVYTDATITPEQAIEATLGRGTCRNVSPKLGNDEFTCEECLARVYGSGGRWFDVNWKYHKFNYCPNCGRRVVAGEES